MSRKNNLERRRKHHAAMLADERVREAKLRKKRDRRRVGKEKKVVDSELSLALNQLTTVIEGDKTSITPRLGTPIVKENEDVKMKVASIGPGRIRKRNKKSRERSKKIKERMLARKAMLD